MRLIKAALTIAAVALAGTLAACSGGPAGSAGGSASSTLTISNENGALWTCDFNPFNESNAFLATGFAYETLAYVNSLQNGKTTPMLATSWSWSSDYKTLTFDIRQGVEFSNGTALTAADVAYTFNLIKKYPALDLTGAWSVLSSVTASGKYTVTMDFSQPAATWFYYVASQVPVVPEAIWSKISNPVAYADSDPVGTGPYEVNPCRSSNITYTANPHYWQPGEPKVQKIQYPAFTSNNTANEELATGQAQWGAQYIPGISSFYTSKSSSFHYWFPPTVNVSLVPNLTNSLLGDVKVRQAMSYAINKSQVSSIGETGYEPAANQTGVVTPTFSAELDKTLLAQYGNYSFSPAKARQLLESDGYTLKNGVMTNARGQQLSFTVISIGDYSDWVASVQVVQQDLAAVGIKITPDNLSSTDFFNDLYDGKYQLAYDDQSTFGPSPYYELNNWLNSADTAPIGKTAATNYERYSSPSTDALLKAYAATTSTTAQQSILNQLEGVMLSDVPVIPVVEAVDWYQYDSAKFTGWPTASDPYAQPSAYAYPDVEQVLLHLSPTR